METFHLELFYAHCKTYLNCEKVKLRQANWNYFICMVKR